MGAFYECVRRGIQVPQQVAIADFHGHDITMTMTPRLATVITPREQIGKMAAEQVLERLKGSTDWTAKLDLGYQIEVGESI